MFESSDLVDGKYGVYKQKPSREVYKDWGIEAIKKKREKTINTNKEDNSIRDGTRTKL